jgi:WD40 repeat protein
VYEVPSGRELDGLYGPDETHTVGFSPDGKRVVTGSRDGAARVIELEGKREIAVCLGHEAAINDAVFRPDGQRVVTASQDCTARIWNVADGCELVSLRGHKDDVRGAAFDAEGRLVVTASFDNAAIIWDATDGRQLEVLPHRHRVDSAGFGPDGSIVLTSCWDGSARLWDVLQCRELRKFSEGEVRKTAFSADGRRIVTSSRDHIIRVWDAASGRQIAEVGKHENAVGVAFSPDGKLILTWGGTGGDGAVFWDVSRTLALWGDPIEVLAASLTNGRGQRSAAEREDLLMQAAPDDLYTALLGRLTSQQRQSVALRADALLRPQHINRYKAPSRLPVG